MKLLLLLCLSFWGFLSSALGQSNQNQTSTNSSFINASTFGFSPNATGLQNTQALQKSVDQGGTIQVSEPGTYNLAGTVYIGSNTSLQFGNGVFIKKVNEQGDFSHVLINKGAKTKTLEKNEFFCGRGKSATTLCLSIPAACVISLP